MVAGASARRHAARGSQRRAWNHRHPARACVAALVGLAIAVAGCGTSAKAPPRAGALVAIGAGLKGPAGLKATVYAAGPTTLSTLALDTRGRLWMGASGLGEHRRDGVYLARPGAVARKVISGLEDPLGLVWHGEKLYVASLGRVDVFSGFDDSRFAEHRRILDGPVRGGENNGLVIAPGGRLVMGITASCDHCTPASRYSGSIVSFRTDGRDLRLYASHIRAPIGLAYYPGTETLFASMNLRDDLGARTPGDWLGVVKRGQDWGAPGCYGQPGAACRGVPQPIAVLDPHAAAGSVAIVTGQLGPGIGTAAVVAEWQKAKVLRVPLTGAGHAGGGTVTPMLTGIHDPFGLIAAPDRSLLVGDWGTGRVYRITGTVASG